MAFRGDPIPYKQFVITMERVVFENKVLLKDSLGFPNYLEKTIFPCVERNLKNDARNRLINAPPGTAKSKYAGIYHMAYQMGVFEGSRFLYISTDEKLLAVQLRILLEIMQSSLYKGTFTTEITSRSLLNISTKGGGIISSRGILAGITGLGGGTFDTERYTGSIIFDEPHPAHHLHQPSLMQEVVNKFYDTLVTRRRNINVPIIIIGQRISDNDLFGALLRSEREYPMFNWDHICIEARDPETGRTINQNAFTDEHLAAYEKMQPALFYAQYMQAPLQSAGTIFDIATLRTKIYEDIPQNKIENISENILIMIDPNGNSTTSSDTTAIVVLKMFFIKGETFKLPHVVIEDIYDQKEPSFAFIIHKCELVIRKYLKQIKYVFPEAHTFGHALSDALISMTKSQDGIKKLELSSFKIIPVKRSAEKRAFMQKVSPHAYTHIYLYQSKMDMYKKMFDEMLNITITNKDCKDDITDALCEGLNQLYEKKAIPCYRVVATRTEDRPRNHLRSIFQ